MNKHLHITVSAILLTITLMISFLLPHEAFCRLLGEAELGYINFESRDPSRSYSAHSLTQHYSVLYDTKGKLSGGRLGAYDVTLGYEWLTFGSATRSNEATGQNSETFHESRGHLNYRGELTINPKEIPFKLNLYSRDLSRGNFSASIADTASSGLTYVAGGYTPVSSGITVGIDNGLHVTSGATLIAGVKNGMTNGYNEVLRHFPMLMLDYRDEINKDLASLTPVDTHLSRLAFVSLNKKDNWFHYRYVTFTDKLDSNNNYIETQIQLGTVDHNLNRRWIDFTNWLSVSADGQFTKHLWEQTQQNYDEFSLNLFGIARRQLWEVRSFSNFTELS